MIKLTYRILGAVLLLSSCAAPLVEHFYTLEAIASPATTTMRNDKLSIVIGPLTLPEIVDRPQMVVHTGPNQVKILEGQRWAESLRSAIPRVLSADLQQRLPGALISVSGASTATIAAATFRIGIDIIRFDAHLGSDVELEAQWRIVGSGGSTLSDRALIREAANGNGYESLAGAHARALQRLGERLSQQVDIALNATQGKR